MSKYPNKASVLVFALVVAAADAQACGEVMLRMGGAMRYQAFLTRFPAEVLVYTGPAALQRAAPVEATKFQDDLTKAGHRVTVVRDAAALSQSLAGNAFDVIITYAGDMDAVAVAVQQVQNEPTVIPVLAKGAGDERALRERFPRLVTDDANLNQLLKVIEQAMRARS